MKARQNCRKQFSTGRLDSSLKHMKTGRTSRMMQLANQTSGQYKSALHRSLTSHPSKRPSWKSVKTRKAEQAVEKRKHCYDDGRDVNSQRPLWRTEWCFLKRLKNRATQHTALQLMGVYIWKTKNRQHTGTPTFRAALFTTAVTSIHLKYPRKEKNG